MWPPRPALLALMVVCAGQRDEHGRLGPGRGVWHLGNPEDFGMNAALLERGAAEVGERAPHRYCLAIIKDGVLVHEER